MNVEAAIDLARAFLTAIQQTRHYGAGHRAALGPTEDLFIRVRRHIAALGTLRIEGDPDWLRIGTAALPVEEAHAAPFAAHLAARRVRAMTLRAEVSLDDVRTLVRLLAREPEEVIAEGGLSEAMRQAGTTTIEIADAGAPPQPPTARAEDPASATAATLNRLMVDAERGHPVDLASARQAVEALARAFARHPLDIWGAIAARRHDELDPVHGVATAVMTIAAAEAMEVLEQPRIDLGVAALLHDIGLAVLPQSARGRERTVEGAQHSWRHPAEGGYVLREAENGGNLAMVVAMEHHLPAVDAAAEVLPHSRLVALTDYLDAMTSARAPALRRATLDGLIGAMLRGEGPRFDPVHVRVLAAVLHDAAIAGVDFWT